MKLHGPSFATGALTIGIAAIGCVLLSRSWGPEPPRSPLDAARERAPSAAPVDPRAAATEQPAAPHIRSLLEPARSVAALLQQLSAARSRLEQIQAITSLLENGSPEARQALLDMFLATDDKVLLALLQEALLRSPDGLAPSLMAAFRGSQDPEKLRRLAEMLHQVASLQPALTEQVVALLIDALSATGDARGDSAAAALLSFGRSALDQLSSRLREAGCGPETADTLAEIMSKLPPECSEVLRDELTHGFDSTRGLLADPVAAEADKDLARKKTGSLAWAASSRPAAEQDALASVLADELGRTADPGQAGTLAWGLENMKGLTDAGRTQTATALLGFLSRQNDGGVRGIIGRSIVELATSGGSGSFDAVRSAIEAARAGEADPAVQDRLRRLLESLDARRISRR